MALYSFRIGLHTDYFAFSSIDTIYGEYDEIYLVYQTQHFSDEK